MRRHSRSKTAHRERMGSALSAQLAPRSCVKGNSGPGAPVGGASDARSDRPTRAHVVPSHANKPLFAWSIPLTGPRSPVHTRPRSAAHAYRHPRHRFALDPQHQPTRAVRGAAPRLRLARHRRRALAGAAPDPARARSLRGDLAAVAAERADHGVDRLWPGRHGRAVHRHPGHRAGEATTHRRAGHGATDRRATGNQRPGRDRTGRRARHRRR